MTGMFEECERDLSQAERILRSGGGMDHHALLLVATLLARVDEHLPINSPGDEIVQSRLGQAMSDLSDTTKRFTSPAFVRAARSVRRQRPELFKAGQAS